MAQPGRKSAAASMVRPATAMPRPRLSPPSPLTNDEHAIFDLTVAKYGHLKPGDAVLVAAFAIASVKVFRLAKKTKDVAGWGRVCRVQAMYATKLRISPQSTT